MVTNMNSVKCKLEEINNKETVSFFPYSSNNSDNCIMKNNNTNNSNNNNNSSNSSNPIDTFIGIDVGKYFIDVYCSLNNKYYLHMANDKTSIKSLITNLKKIKGLTPMNTLVVIDLTGNYEVLCRDLFYDNSFTNIHLADGKKIKYFKKSKGNSIAKTDKSDAFILAMYAKENLNSIVLYANDNNNNKKELEELQKIELRIEDLKHFLVKEKNRLQAPNVPKLIKKDIEQTIEYIESKIDKLEIEAKKIIENNESLNKKYNILIKQHGIGDVTARTLISFLPELGTLNKSKISSLSGTAPIAKDSGTLKGYRTTKGNGRKTIKHTLFMSMLSIIRKKDSHLNLFYNSLLKKGKTKMVAMVACMRKLIIYLNSLMKKEYFLGEVN